MEFKVKDYDQLKLLTELTPLFDWLRILSIMGEAYYFCKDDHERLQLHLEGKIASIENTRDFIMGAINTACDTLINKMRLDHESFLQAQSQMQNKDS